MELDAKGAFVSPTFIRQAISNMKSHHFEPMNVLMHPAQVMAFENSANLVFAGTHVEARLLNWNTERTMDGIPIIEDSRFPINVISFVDEGGRVLLDITNLAVPEGVW